MTIAAVAQIAGAATLANGDPVHQIHLSFANGRPVGTPEDVLTGFVDGEGNALGRPVGVAVDRAGALLVADDVGNAVWRVAPAKRKQ
jgi:glucose/arabinose dehydrogenase